MAADHVDYRQALDPAHLYTLKELLQWPARYMQRVVERVSFLPAGGERWQRNVQIWIPPMDRGTYKLPGNAGPPRDGRYVVSLGMFRRSRFPDFEVKDAAGERLQLLTRDQHQHCVVMSTLLKYLTYEQWEAISPEAERRSGANERSGAEEKWLRVYGLLGRLVTDVARKRLHSIDQIVAAGKELFEAVGVSDVDAAAEKLARDCYELSRFTHYLCWIDAEWGETVSLSATYTMADNVRLAGDRKPLLASDGTQEKSEDTWLQRLRMRMYTRLGLCPVYYEFRAPAHDHTGSYYFSVEPPDDAHVSVLDWGSGRRFDPDSGEVDSAFFTYHDHVDDPGDDDEDEDEDENEGEAGVEASEPLEDSRISAFLKGDSADVPALVAIAVFNLVVAFLVQDGSFLPLLAGQQQWILLAPTILVGLVAQHRARFETRVTRPLRGVLWIYLTVNVLFGVSVAFDLSESGESLFGDAPLEDIASGLITCVSIALISLLAASAAFDQATQKLYKRRLERAGDAPVRYLAVARRYADAVAIVIVAVVAATIIAMLILGWGGERRAEVASAKAPANYKGEQPDADYILPAGRDYDVFLAYNSNDRLAVEQLAGWLRGVGLRPWLAPEQIPPGHWFQRDIENAIGRVASAAIVVGRSGLGRWQAIELQAFLAESVERGLPIVPVLLPNADIPSELKFLRQFSWVRFEHRLDEAAALADLRWGITGAR